MVLLLHATLIIILAWHVGRREDKRILPLYILAWAVKMLAGAAVGFVHCRCYPQSDVMVFYSQAKELAHLGLTDFAGYLNYLFLHHEALHSGEARSLFFTKLLSAVALLTGNSFWLMTAWLSIISFYCTWYLFRTLMAINTRWKTPAALAFLFFPSAVFWTSGLLKETLAVAGMHFTVAVFLKIWSGLKPAWGHYLLTVLALTIAWKLKYYVVAAALPLLLAAALVRIIIRKSAPARKFDWLLLVAVSGALFLLPGLFHPNLRLERVVRVAVENRNALIEQETDKNRLTAVTILESSFTEVVQHIPQSLFNGFYAPFKPEKRINLYMLSVGESWLLLLLTLAAAAGVAVPGQRYQRLLLIAVCAYCLLMATWLGLAVPAAGTLVRYRVAFLPWWVFVLFLAIKNAGQRYLRGSNR
ncbi:MAG: hypothetical protein KatS3mg032_2274 [Cyclobacteriaceae bacterium]|nr:MAG: hypothetical protein KatS3mg032_2274 [Cyclobacteriaceae bacterium]